MSGVEWALLACIPFLFIIGVILAWKWENAGGIVILASVIAFNIIDIAAASFSSGKIKFTYFIIPGILFIIAAYLDRKEHYGRAHRQP